MNARLLADTTKPETSSIIRINLLGKMQIIIAEQDRTRLIKYRKGFGLIALLAVECNILHPRDRIADLLWPDLPLNSARSNLRQVLSNLAKVFEPAFDNGAPILRITTTSVGLFVGKNVDIDVASIQATCDGLRHTADMPEKLYSEIDVALASSHAVSREFLAGFELAECESFMEWLSHQRHYFSDCVITIYEDISDRAEAIGDLDTAITFIRKAVAIDPLLEANQLRLANLLAITGRKERALRELSMFVTHLRNELDVTPGAGVQALQKQIVQGHIATQPKLQSSENMRWISAVYAVCAPNADDVRERSKLSRQSREQTMEVLRRNGAYVVQPPGRGLFAYFGWSESQKGCARNALSSAREILRYASSANHVRIGIYTSQVYVDNPSKQLDELGECSDIAYRLSLAADGGEIVLCGETLRNVQTKYEEMGVKQLHGIAVRVSLFRAVH